jgi:peptidoglycan/LPS O-acetylase OafA/YrhL
MLHTLVINVLLNGIADHLLHLQGPAVALMTLCTFVIIWPISYLSLVFLERPARSWLGGSYRRSGLHSEDAAVKQDVTQTARVSL